MSYTSKRVGSNFIITTTGAETVPLYTYTVATGAVTSSILPLSVRTFLAQQAKIFAAAGALDQGTFQGLTLARPITGGLSSSLTFVFGAGVLTVSLVNGGAGIALVNFPATVENGFQAIPAGISGGGVTSVSAGTGISVTGPAATPTIALTVPIALGNAPVSLRALVATPAPAGAYALDFSAGSGGGVTLNQNTSFTMSNAPAGASLTIRYLVSVSPGPWALTFPAGWRWVGTKPAATGAGGGTSLLTLTNFGTTDNDIVAEWNDLT